MNSQTQMMSSACQNRAKQSRRRSHGGAKALDCDLRHHHRQPDQSGGDVQPVAADKREEGGQETRCAAGSAPRAIMPANSRISRAEERGPEHERDQRKEVGAGTAPRVDRQRHQSARVARGEKTSGFDRDADLIEQLRAGRAARSRMHEHRVGGKQRREHHDVAQEEDPEAVGDDDPLRRGTGFAGSSAALRDGRHRWQQRRS